MWATRQQAENVTDESCLLFLIVFSFFHLSLLFFCLFQKQPPFLHFLFFLILLLYTSGLLTTQYFVQYIQNGLQGHDSLQAVKSLEFSKRGDPKLCTVRKIIPPPPPPSFYTKGRTSQKSGPTQLMRKWLLHSPPLPAAGVALTAVASAATVVAPATSGAPAAAVAGTPTTAVVVAAAATAVVVAV